MNEHPVGAPESASTSHIFRRPKLRYAFAVLVAAIFISSGTLSWSLQGIRLPSAPEVTSRPVIALSSADGQYLWHKGQLRLPPVAVKDMPTDVVNAVLSIEDRRFYQHGGVDLFSVLRRSRKTPRLEKSFPVAARSLNSSSRISFLARN